jgi:hypothetical protein
MMKRSLLLLTFTLFASIYCFAQKGKNQVNFGPEADLPIGTMGDAYKLGFGGTLKGLLGVGKTGQVTLTLGYSTFKGKSGTSGGYSYAGQTFNVIPFLVGYRNNFNKFYIEPQLGLASYTTKVTGFKETETRLTYGLSVGYAINSFDLGLRYQGHEGASFIGARVAYVIDL